MYNSHLKSSVFSPVIMTVITSAQDFDTHSFDNTELKEKLGKQLSRCGH